MDDGRDVQVGSFDDGTIFTYPLPLSRNLSRKLPLAANLSNEPYVAPFSGRHWAEPAGRIAMNGGLPSGLGDLSGLAVTGGYLYVAGAGYSGQEGLRTVCRSWQARSRPVRSRVSQGSIS